MTTRAKRILDMVRKCPGFNTIKGPTTVSSISESAKSCTNQIDDLMPHYVMNETGSSMCNDKLLISSPELAQAREFCESVDNQSEDGTDTEDTVIQITTNSNFQTENDNFLLDLMECENSVTEIDENWPQSEPELTELMNVPINTLDDGKHRVEELVHSPSSLNDPFSDDSDSDYIPDKRNSSFFESYTQGADENTSSEDISKEENKSESSAGQDKSVQQISRKRKSKPDTWNRNVMKKSRNLGKSYTNTRNKVVSERKLKEACRNTCRLQCTNRITKDMRLSIFEEYWALGDVNRQRDFILRFVDLKNKKRQRIRNQQKSQARKADSDEDEKEEKSRRKMSYFYHLESEEGDREKVCQTFFLNTLGISHQVVKTVAKKITAVKSVITVDEDKRGRHKAKKCIDAKEKQFAKDHINTFEAVESHYIRKDSSRKYLPGSLNISKMYRLYIDYCGEKGVVPVRESMYRWIFLNEFNLGFHIPKKDQCDLCANYQNANDNEKLQLKERIDIHLRNKDAMRKLKEDDKLRALTDETYCLAIFDLQQILQCPKVEVGQAYYKSKVATYNLTVYEAGNKQGYCYMWHESIASRGTCEIGSCILDFIKTKAQSGCKEISFYSDNCAGQNKNKFMYIMLLYAAVKYKMLITLNFMEVGHTQNEGDSMHSAIERCARRIPIYTPGQWYTIARTACIKRPYLVKEMNQTDFFDLKDLLVKTTSKIDKDDSGNVVKWSGVSCVQANYEHPHLLNLRYKLRSFFAINVTERSRKPPISFSEYNLKQLRSNFIPISKFKYESILYYCKSNAITKEYQDFFLNLPHE